MEPKRYIKAIYAFIWTLLSSLVLVVDSGLTALEILGVAILVVGATGGVYGLKNAPMPIEPERRLP